MRRFPLNKNYSLLLKNQNISISEVLRRAGLPEDLFVRKDAFLTDAEYMRFMVSIDLSIENPQIPILLATAKNIESVNPPIFAAYCSKDAKHCIKRLAQYKALSGTVCFDVQDTENEIAVTTHAVDEKQELPEIIVGIEMVLLTNLIREATRQNIIPHKIIVKHPFQNPEYEKFLSCTAEIGTKKPDYLLIQRCRTAVHIKK